MTVCPSEVVRPCAIRRVKKSLLPPGGEATIRIVLFGKSLPDAKRAPHVMAAHSGYAIKRTRIMMLPCSRVGVCFYEYRDTVVRYIRRRSGNA